jgi:hypothetical protein
VISRDSVFRDGRRNDHASANVGERTSVIALFVSVTANCLKENRMNLIILILLLMFLFGGGGYYYGGPYIGGGLGTVLLIVLIVVLLRG